jgi:GH15 family glucan-1,4-alpha-glucosidase
MTPASKAPLLRSSEGSCATDFGSGDTAATEDGLPPGEGAFLPHSFWLADAYVLTGRTADAQRLFERLVGLCNDVGLLAEEYDIASGSTSSG